MDEMEYEVSGSYISEEAYELGERIYRLRKEKGYSQGELADRLNISRQAVSKWENGQSQPDIYKLKLLSREFGISVDELLDADYVKPSDVSNSRTEYTFGNMHITVGVIIMCFSLVFMFINLLVSIALFSLGVFALTFVKGKHLRNWWIAFLTFYIQYMFMGYWGGMMYFSFFGLSIVSLILSNNILMQIIVVIGWTSVITLSTFTIKSGETVDNKWENACKIVALYALFRAIDFTRMLIMYFIHGFEGSFGYLVPSIFLSIVGIVVAIIAVRTIRNKTDYKALTVWVATYCLSCLIIGVIAMVNLLISGNGFTLQWIDIVLDLVINVVLSVLFVKRAKSIYTNQQ